MLAAVLPDSSMDFPDGAQRFNWCNCQPSAKRSLAGIGNNSLAPSNFLDVEEYNEVVLAQSRPQVTPRPQTPLVDFNFWESYLRGGGGATATPDPIGDFSLAIPGGTPVAVLAGAAAIVGVLWLTLGGKKGK